jgi:hypothetical protein
MRLLAIALVIVLAPLAIAQRTLPARAGHFPRHHSSSSPLTSFLTPFLGDSFDPADLSSSGDPSAQGPAFLLEATRALSGSGGFPGQPDRSQPSSSPSSSSEPLLIELQGDRYVRVTTAAIDGEAQPLVRAQSAVRAGSAQPSKSPGSHFTKPRPQNSVASSSLAMAAAPPELPPAILIFRDGHSEEVRDYTIANGFLYARGDFYRDGYWNKRISLESLNLPQTSQANARRNINFMLPLSPNEVVARF